MKNKLKKTANNFITYLGYSIVFFGVIISIASAFSPSIRQNMEKRIEIEREHQREAHEANLVLDIEKKDKEKEIVDINIKLNKELSDINQKITNNKIIYHQSQGVINSNSELLEDYKYNDELTKAYEESQKKKIIYKDIFFTSYNPEVGQTDSTPCIAGGTGMNLCNLYKEGVRTIALSQDMITWSKVPYKQKHQFKAGDKVVLESTDYPDDPRCNGEFTVGDALNARYQLRGDLFFPNRKDNISCKAHILIYNYE